MVDKENQWDDDIEYSQYDESDEGYEDSDYSDNDGEYSDDDYDNYDENYEEDYEDNDDSKSKKSNQLPLIIIALLLFGIAGFIFMSKMNAGKEEISDMSVSSSQATVIETAAPVSQQEGDALLSEPAQITAGSAEDLGDMFFEQAGGNADDMTSIEFNDNGSAQVAASTSEGETAVATVTDTTDTLTEDDLFATSGDLNLDPSKENNDIIISYDKPGRENPFKPLVTADAVKEASLANTVMINNAQFEIIEPPTVSVPDENLTKLLQTQVSGILYDDVSPSAIVNLNGKDSFVKIGDVISGYEIQSIARDKVQITYKNNTYVASVGQLFTRGQLEKQRAVANLEKKFAGRYKEE